MGSLFIVSTPIGNLSDITLRALEVLRSVDAIACEDTRHTMQLLSHFDIHKPLISCRVQNEKSVAQKIITLLKEGKNIAYASDAGTPGISDPGSALVRLVREAGEAITPIPGAAAFVTLLSVAGVGKSALFDGFLSIKRGKRLSRLKALRPIYDSGTSIVLYESPYRILKLLEDIADVYSESKIILGRELTKLHEEIIAGTAKELIDCLSTRPAIKGEFALVITSGDSREDDPAQKGDINAY